MNRIVISPFSFGLGAEFPDGIRRLNLGSIYASNEGQRNRHPVSLFLKVFFWKHWLGVGNGLTRF